MSMNKTCPISRRAWSSLSVDTLQVVTKPSRSAYFFSGKSPALFSDHATSTNNEEG